MVDEDNSDNKQDTAVEPNPSFVAPIYEASDTPQRNEESTYNSAEPKEIGDSALAKWTRALVIWTACLFIAAVGSDVFQYFQWGELRSADETNRQTLIANQRAWVGPLDANLSGAPEAGKPATVIVSYHNTGREPARDTNPIITPYIATVTEDQNGTLGQKISMYLSNCLSTQPRVAGQVIFPTT